MVKIGIVFADGYFESTFDEDYERSLSNEALSIIMQIRKQGEIIKQELFKKIEYDFKYSLHV